MNHLPVTLRIILSTLIAWGLISSCNKVEDHIEPHEVNVITSINIAYDPDDWSEKYPGESFPDPVPEYLIFKMRVTGIYNDGTQRALTDDEITDFVKWRDSSTDDFEQVETCCDDQGQSYGPGEISLKMQGKEDETVGVVALYLPNSENGGREFPSQNRYFELTKPTLEDILILEEEDATEDDYCNLTLERERLKNKIIKGCLKQFKAIGKFDNNREVDLTNFVEWSPTHTTLADFVRTIYDPSNYEARAELNEYSWGPYVDSNIQYKGLEGQYGLALGKNLGDVVFKAKYPDPDIGNLLDYRLKFGSVTGETADPYEIISAEMKELRLSIPIEPPNDGDCEDKTNCVQVEYDETNDIYYMIENTHAYSEVSGVFENKGQLSIAGSVDWSWDTDNISVDNISVDKVSGIIAAKAKSGEIVVTASKDLTSDSVKLKVNEEILESVSFWVDSSEDSDERHEATNDKHGMTKGNAYYDNSRQAKLYVKGKYNNTARLISSKKRHCRELELNYSSTWEVTSDTEGVTSTLNALYKNGLEMFRVKRKSESDWDPDSCTVQTNFPMWFDISGDQEFDEEPINAMITVEVSNVADSSADDKTVTHIWDALLVSGSVPVNIQITPAIDTETDKWIAEKLIKLEAVAVYESEVLIGILPHSQSRWHYYISHDSEECDAEAGEWSECDIDEVDFKCVKDNSGIHVMTHEKLCVKAEEIKHRRFDMISISPIEDTKLLSIELYPQVETLKAGELVFFTAEGMFDNNKMYDLSNNCLNWSVEPSEDVTIDNGVFRSFADLTADKNITLTVRLKEELTKDSYCNGIDWQEIVGDISGDADITVNSLPSIDFSGSDFSVHEGSADIEITVNSGAAPGKDIIIPYKVGGTASWVEDHDLTADYVVIKEGENVSSPIVFNTKEDDLNEYDETVKIRIFADSLVNFRDGSNDEIIITIKDDDATPDLSFIGASSKDVNENDGLVFISFELTDQTTGARIASGRDIIVGYNPSGDAVEGKDYVYSKSDSFTIKKGSKTDVLIFNIVNDRDYEREEILEVNIHEATVDNARWIGDFTYTFYIEDNDSLSISSEEYPPDSCTAGGTYKFEFTVNTDLPVNVTMTNAPEEWGVEDQPVGRKHTLLGDCECYPPDRCKYEGIFICVEDASDDTVMDCLPPFDVEVQQAN